MLIFHSERGRSPLLSLIAGFLFNDSDLHVFGILTDSAACQPDVGDRLLLTTACLTLAQSVTASPACLLIDYVN